MVSILYDNYENIKNAFNQFPRLESERFHLKEFREEDFNNIYEVFSDDEIMRFSGINVVEPFRQAKNYMNIISLMYKKKQGIRWAIYDKTNNSFVGDIGLFNINEKDSSAEIGYLITKGYWKKGVGTECSKEVINFAINNLNIEKILAIIDKDNIPSIKLIKKLEFKMEYEFTQLNFNRIRKSYYMFSFKNNKLH